MKCLTCSKDRNIKRGDGRLRTRCNKCWNEYCRKNRKLHLDYYSNYINKYTALRRKNYDYRNKNNEINNKSNKKAIAELKQSYLKNRIMEGRSWNDNMGEFIEIKRLSIEIKRHGKIRI